MTASASSRTSPQHLHFSAATLVEDTARLIVSQHTAQLPDLSALTIVIAPRAAPALKRALVHEAAAHRHAALLLPRIGTLEDFAAAIRVAGVSSMVSNQQRALQVYQALKHQRWFSPAECLRVSRELVSLVDGLTHQMAVLPTTLEEHGRALTRAYMIGKPNTDFSFEATLTYDIWRTLAQPAQGAVDSATRYALQLAMWAAQAVAPLYMIDTAALTRRERTFVEAYAARAPLVLIDPVLVDNSPRGAFIAQAFAAAPGGAVVTEYSGCDTTWLQCHVARDVEEEANAALAVLKRWLMAGKREIAVVALDRLTARRLRALAERDSILMQDEIGWPYSTTVSAAALMRWLEAKQDGFYHTTVFDLLKSPFIFADWRELWGRERLKAAVSMIERAARRADVVAGLARLCDALVRFNDAENGTAAQDAQALLERLADADAAFPWTRRTPAAWLKALRASLAALGIQAGLERDLAGRGLLTVLEQLENDVAAIGMLLSASEWLDWLRAELEHARFRDTAIISPIVLTSLEATRLRTFEGVLVIGASAANLPGLPPASSVFNQSVRHALGLPTHIEQMKSITRDLAGLMQRVPVCCISWQSDTTIEPVPPAPWVHALIVVARRNGMEILQNAKTSIAACIFSEKRLKTGSGSRLFLINFSQPPRPAVKSTQLPTRISASGYQSLVDCPYQFFSRSVLSLREAEDIEETMDKRDFGELVHVILHRFHTRFPLISVVDDTILKGALADDTATVFKETMQQNFIARAWLLQWESAIDAYLDWQRQREADGWRWQQGEAPGALAIPLAGGTTLTLEGRLDRIDSRPALNTSAAKEQAVIDYKARAAAALRKKLKLAGEDVQLPIYVALLSATNAATNSAASAIPVVEATYLSIMCGEVKPIVYAEVATAGAQARQRLATMFEALHSGAGLPAQGVEAVCTHCEARGLCRRDHWNSDADD